ncbi:MAG: ATP-binding protein [Pseudomonadaceae bacterium]|nr:ATP-binding protein [Pseudomonadaceae bacterium]
MNTGIAEAAACLLIVGVSCVYVLAKGSPRFLAAYLPLACVSAVVYCTGHLTHRIVSEPQSFALALYVLYAGLMGTVTFWWVSILDVAQHYRYVPAGITKPIQKISLSAMLLLLLGLITNPWHGQFLVPNLVGLSEFKLLWYLNAGILWLFISCACLLAIYCAGKTQVRADRVQMTLLALAMLIPGLFNGLYLSGVANIEGDPTAIGLAFSSTVFIYAIFRGQLYVLSGVRIDQFMDNLKRPGILVDRHYRLVYMNNAARETFGDLPVHTPVAPVLASKLVSGSADALTPERIEESPGEVFQVVDQPDTWSSISAQPILTGQKQIGSMWLFEDETSKVRASRQFAADQRLDSLRMMAAGIAHDFNNLLQGVIGNAELVELNLQGDVTHAKDLLTKLISGAQRAAGLSQKLLAYSGRAQIKVENIDLNELVQDVLTFMQIDLAPSVPINVALSEQQIRVAVDPVQVAEIVFNLLTNAYEAAHGQEGSIWLSSGQVELDQSAIDACQIATTAVPGLYCFLSVADSGCGLTPDTMARIFEPFYSTKELGRGLGLAAVSGIVATHGGALRVFSPAGTDEQIDNKGRTEFIVYFKALDAA